MAKFIFVTGGVISSLGKGIASASMGRLLESRGYRVAMLKFDPYLNVDPGTMSPYQHGEVFVTDDGWESDLDLGHYERFTSGTTSKESNWTAGKIYELVINKERRGEYLGKTVQVIPHVTDEIKDKIRRIADSAHVVIVEVGGTVGDIESLPFLEAIRQFHLDVGDDNAIFVHLTLVPFIGAAGELKTKPTQHSVRDLREIGINPHLLLCRADRPIPEEVRAKIALFTNLPKDRVFTAPDVETIYAVPTALHEQGVDAMILKLLGLPLGKARMDEWNRFVEGIRHPKHVARIGVVGKYVGFEDSYKSLNEALVHAGVANDARVACTWIESSHLAPGADANRRRETLALLEQQHGILVPGGFGDRGVEGMIETVRFARERKIPYFGICLGLQVACIEFARNVADIAGAASGEFEPTAEDRVIIMLSECVGVNIGGSMRLGRYECKLEPGSLARRVYGREVVAERHRHRYEFNNSYRTRLEEAGLTISGTTLDGSLVEMIEVRDHPWFLACQFHPEFLSRPLNPHPIFREFVHAAMQHAAAQDVPPEKDAPPLPAGAHDDRPARTSQAAASSLA
jgi:CTP synthase